jgi:hypothetical protein
MSTGFLDLTRLPETVCRNAAEIVAITGLGNLGLISQCIRCMVYAKDEN